MIDNATFQIIGRIGNINTSDKVTRISLATDRPVKGEQDNWTTKTNWLSVTVFNEALRKRLKNSKVGKKGNKLIVQGSLQENNYEKNGETIYTTNLVAQDFDVIAFTSDSK
ncbi:single-stranded DNA-binding protein [Ahrensia marina]|jgi:single-stranded DNA-binding protein|uniref:Single-stranded DNA-binding protein n=1 Tax=Ahrensia marina TaxID=1514904 RepID=A0A0N0VLH7_9HYPH|nr:single-stranded DNA-binding protein [Ahrensia marina]KPB00684.1 hypothetical protein SU32_12785 [Ahrensia marina]